MKKIIALCFLIAAGVCLHAQTLSWGIKFFKGNGKETVPVNRIIGMETGESFEIDIIPDSDCFGYIIAHDTQRNIHVLHNTPLKKASVLTLGPAQLTEPGGTETIYIIMSLKKETKLEKLIQTYNKDPGAKKHSDNLHREIARLQTSVSGLGEPSASFIPSGGTSRGGNTEEYVNRFSDKSIYVRTVTIRH